MLANKMLSKIFLLQKLIYTESKKKKSTNIGAQMSACNKSRKRNFLIKKEKTKARPLPPLQKKVWPAPSSAPRQSKQFRALFAFSSALPSASTV